MFVYMSKGFELKLRVIHALSLALVAVFPSAHGSNRPVVPGSGIELQYVDPSVRAQDDFLVHLNGLWLKKAEIPADKSSWGTFAKLRDDVQPQLLVVIENAQKK